MTDNKVTVDYDSKAKRFEIRTPFMMNGVAKALPSRKWNKARRCWLAPPMRANVAYIKNNIATMSMASVSDAAAEAVTEVLMAATKIQNKSLPQWYRPKMPSRKYQQACCDKLYGRSYGGLFMCCGSGKTKAVLDIVCAKVLDKADIDMVVVACPFSIRSNWLKELQKHCSIEYAATVLDTKTTGGKRSLVEVMAATAALRVLIVGIESLSSGGAAEHVRAFMRTGKCAFVLDEMSKIKTHNSKRTKAITKLGQEAVLRYGLTGTPVTQGVQDLYSQLNFLSPDILGYGDYYSFRNHFLVMGGFNNKEIVGYNHVEELMSLMEQHVFQITLQEALPELPERTYVRRDVVLTPEQNTKYKQLLAEKTVAAGDSEITVQNALEQMLRLQQITGGSVPVTRVDLLTEKVVSDTVDITCKKLDESVAIADENASASIIYWCRFRSEIRRVADALRSKFGEASVVEFHGGIEAAKRWENIQQFESKQARFFVGNQATGGIGIDLITASIVVYYSNSFSLEDRIQSEARNFRMGQKNAVTYIDLICPGTVDDDVVEALGNKENIADYVRRALQQGEKR